MEASAYAVRAPGLALQSFLQRVFMWMFAGLLLSGAVCAVVTANQSWLDALSKSPTYWFVIGGQLALAFALILGINRMAPGAALALFFLYAGAIGITFAVIFQFYTTQSIWTAFAVTGVLFGAMAAIGYTTKADLTKLGTILFAALIALIVATLINVFVASSTLYWVTTYAGVVIFAGLTAYDMQKLKRINQQGVAGDQGRRLEVIGAFALYLDFINMFLFLLRIFGNSR